jgi:hypothetical protein
MCKIEQHLGCWIKIILDIGATTLRFSKVELRQISAQITSGPSPRVRGGTLRFVEPFVEPRDFVPPLIVSVHARRNFLFRIGVR